MPGCSGALTIAVAVMAAALIFEANTSLRMLQKGGEVSDQVPVRDAESGPRRAWKGRSSIILQLPATAQGHSDDVAANDYSDHTGSDGSKMTQRIKKAGFEGNGYAENVAAGQASVQTRDGVVDKVNRSQKTTSSATTSCSELAMRATRNPRTNTTGRRTLVTAARKPAVASVSQRIYEHTVQVPSPILPNQIQTIDRGTPMFLVAVCSCNRNVQMGLDAQILEPWVLLPSWRSVPMVGGRKYREHHQTAS